MSKAKKRAAKTAPADPVDVLARDIYADMIAVSRDTTKLALGDVLWEVSQVLAKTYAPRLLLETSATHQTPDGKLLELCVTARPISDYGEPVHAHKARRDVYLAERDPKDRAARSLFLMHSDCPIATVKRLLLWAEMLRIPIRFDPSANMEPGWEWPKGRPAIAPKPPADSALDF